MHTYLHKKVEEVEHERTEDRSWATKENLLKLKKQKLLLGYGFEAVNSELKRKAEILREKIERNIVYTAHAHRKK